MSDDEAEDRKSVKKAMDLIMEAAELLGWEVAFKRGPPDQDDQDVEVKYLIIGIGDEVDRIISILEAPQNHN